MLQKKQLALDVPTRWNSVLHMFRRMWLNRVAVLGALQESTRAGSSFHLSSKQREKHCDRFKALNDALPSLPCIMVVLDDLLESTNEIQGDNGTAAEVMILIDCLERFLQVRP